MAMVRKQIYLEKKQDQLLKRLAKARGLSEAEVIRQAIEREAALSGWRPDQIDDNAFEAFRQAALARRELGITGEPYRWKREDAYEEREQRLTRQLAIAEKK